MFRFARDRNLLPFEGEKSLNFIQSLGSRPFQDQRQTFNLMKMSHSHSSRAERLLFAALRGTWRGCTTAKAVQHRRLTRHSTIGTQRIGNCLGIFGILASELAVAEDELWMLDIVWLAPRANYRASRFELDRTRQEACR